MSAAPVSNHSPSPSSAADRPRVNLAEIGADVAVWSTERLTVLIAGGSEAASAAVSSMVGESSAGVEPGESDRHPMDVVVVAHSPNAMVRLRAGGVHAVVVFDDLCGRSVLRGMVDAELDVPLVQVLEQGSERRAEQSAAGRAQGARSCVFLDELTDASLEALLLASVETQRMLDAVAQRGAAVCLDPQTGLMTSAAFERRLAVAMGHAESDPSSRYAVLCIDASRVHEGSRLTASDAAALRGQVARRIARDPQVRLAAATDEHSFCVMLSGIEDGEDLELAEEIRHRLQAPYSLGEVTMHLDLGFGLARGRGLDADAAAAIARARGEVRTPKAVSRATVRSAPVPATAAQRAAQELQEALDNDQFAITYQPIVELDSGAPRGFEALIRWNHPDGEERPAASFIGAANDSNLIVPIGYWCLEGAMRQMADWQADFEEARDQLISINLSTPQVLDPLFPARVRSLLMTTGLNPASVRFEIEAGTICEHNTRARSLVQGLVDAGTKVWVEDYGLSPCTVDDLRGFPLDGFKIDRRFVSKIDGTDMTSGRIRHIVTAAQALGVRTLGEGIENALQANVLRWLGCTLGQGYLFAKPLQVGDAFAFLAGQGS